MGFEWICEILEDDDDDDDICGGAVELTSPIYLMVAKSFSPTRIRVPTSKSLTSIRLFIRLQQCVQRPTMLNVRQSAVSVVIFFFNRTHNVIRFHADLIIRLNIFLPTQFWGLGLATLELISGSVRLHCLFVTLFVLHR